MLVASIEPPVTVRPEADERPPLVEMDRPPSKVEVPVPLTVMRLAMSKDVVDAIGKTFRIVVEVEMKDSAVTEEPKSPVPAEEICAPGDEVPMPRYPPAVRARREVVAKVKPERVGRSTRKISSVC